MEVIHYREFKEKDFIIIKSLINNAFSFDKFLRNDDLLNAVLGIFLEESISESSFIKVAEKGDKLVGFIFASAKNASNNYSDLLDTKISRNLESYMERISEFDKSGLAQFMQIKEAYKELLLGKEKTFGGAINLFIVSEECRGFGVGKRLLKYVLNYMEEMKVDSLYLFTDTRCNYGFYDSQRFKRLSEKKLYLEALKSELRTFLYYYNF